MRLILASELGEELTGAGLQVEWQGERIGISLLKLDERLALLVNLQDDRRLCAEIRVNLPFERGFNVLYRESALFGVVAPCLQPVDVLCGRSADRK